jgi:chromosome segregation ATPase
MVMRKIDELKSEIVRLAKIEGEIMPAVLQAKRQLQVLTDKQGFYQKQSKDLEASIVNLDKEVKDGLAAGDDSVEKTIQKRNVLREKKAGLEALAIEIEDVLLPAAQAELSGAESRLFGALRESVLLCQNDLVAELNKRLEEIEAGMEIWRQAVYAVNAEFVPTFSLFSSVSVVLKNAAVRRALGF